MRRRTGSTLVETLFTVLIAVVVLGVVLALLISGVRMYLSTLNTAQGRQAATLFFDQLQADLTGCTIIPTRRCDPVAISKDSARIAFYRADHAHSTLQVTIAEPVEHALATKDGKTHPARNGEVRTSVAIESVRYELIRPDLKRGAERSTQRKAWLLRVDARFPAGDRDRPLRVVRLIELVQPTSAIEGPHFAGEIPLGTFVFKKGPRPMMELLKTAGLGMGISAPPPGVGVGKPL